MHHFHLDRSYDMSLVILSIVVAMFASYAALNIVHRVLHQLKRFTLVWIVVGSFVEGLGIWSMHFIGMMAHKLPFPVAYDITLLIVSMLLPICSSFIALRIVTLGSNSMRRWIFGGLFMSSAIAGMHYTGMAAMIIPANISYDPYLVLLSILIALVISYTALWLYFKSSSRRLKNKEKLLGGCLLGAAIASMHYTGMAAAKYELGDPVSSVGKRVLATADHFTLVIWVSAAALLMLLLIFLSRTIESRVVIRMAKWGERRYYFMFERSPDLVSLFDVQGNLLQANPSVHRISGYSARELAAIQPLQLVEQTERDKVKSMFNRSATGVSQTGEIAIRHKKGDRIYLNLTMIPLIVSGRIEDIYMLAQDITERKQLELQLWEANQAKSRFLASVIHEIRTQLNAIAGLSHLLQRTELSEKQQDYLGIIQSASRSIRSIINNNLDYSKIESNMLELEVCPFSLEMVLKDVADVVALRAAEKGLELFILHDSKAPKQLIGDPMRLGQVLTNLVDNAVKFTENGKIIVRTTLVAQSAEKTTIHFSVKDDGIGISKEHQTLLFEPFVQAESSTTRKYGGTGLGLPISKRLVERMNGQIAVESELGGGSEFSFTADFGIEIEQPAAKETVEKKLHIAIVTDNNAMCQFIVETLQAEGHLIALDKDGKRTRKALSQMQSTSMPYADLIILDWEMEGNAEQDERAIIVEQARVHSIPIFTLVNCLHREQLNGDMEQWTENYWILQKPLLNFELLSAVEHLMHANFARKQHRQPEQEIVENEVAATATDEARILIVEDLELNRVILQELLKPYIRNIEAVADGVQAIKRLANTSLPPFDLILIDLHMPEMDGYDTTKRIRQLDQAIPIIAVSANAFIWEKQKCVEAGIDDYIGKPIDPQLLHQTVSIWLQAGSRIKGRQEGENYALQQDEGIGLLNSYDLLDRLGGSPELLNQLYMIFYREQAELDLKLQQLVEQQDWAGLQLQLHNLKGAAGNMSMDMLAETTRELESKVKQGKVAEIAGDIEQLISLLHKVLAAVSARLAREGLV
ncbi:MHYT domain-containing protein [Paenibacillus sp. GCM10027626]|uniref:MHYT domain-containing protein n=1 Tax=Paenibacillus sp. GCM10027626 TaxID=3273411 RepID=UPI0036289A3D